MTRFTIPQLVAKAIPDARDRIPASPEELAEMADVAALTAPLRELYSLTGELGAEDFELFEPELFIDVNAERDEFGELAELTFFAADFGSGFFATDPLDYVGLGRGAIFHAQRGEMIADALVPCDDTLAAFLANVLAGNRVWKGTTLGERAEDRLMARLEHLPDAVEPGPPLDPAEFVKAREEGLFVPIALANMLERTNGLWFGENRRIYRFEEMRRVPGSEAVIIGEDAKLGKLAVTPGGWRELPADRLVALPNDPSGEPLMLGRTADVIGLWLDEAAR